VLGQIGAGQPIHHRVLIIEVELRLQEGDRKGVGKGAETIADERPVPIELGSQPLAIRQRDAPRGDHPQTAQDFVRGELDLADEHVAAVLVGADVLK